MKSKYRIKEFYNNVALLRFLPQHRKLCFWIDLSYPQVNIDKAKQVIEYHKKTINGVIYHYE